MKKSLNVLFCVGLMMFASPCWSATPSLPTFVLAKLQKVHSLMNTESWSEARDLLEELRSETRHKYAQALIGKSLGQIAIHMDNTQLALKHFQQAYDAKALRANDSKQLLHSISQLHCVVEEWVLCRDKMSLWISESQNLVQAKDYITVAHAYSMTEVWEEVIPAVKAALSLNRRAPKSWHQMLVVAHNNLEQWPEAISAQQNFLGTYPNEVQEWRRLVALQINNDDLSAALNSMRLPYENGLLKEEGDLKQIALLFLQSDLPYLAGLTLEEGLNKGWLESSEANLKLLASCWVSAKAYDRAISSYSELVQTAPKLSWYKHLAALYFQEKNWYSVAKLIQDANENIGLEIPEKEKSKLNLILGMALINLDQLDEAELVLNDLTNHESVKPQAENWLKYIEQVRRV